MNAVELLKSFSEAEFTELVILPLLERLGYTSIRRLHGKLELGKDVVASREDPIQGTLNFAFAIKSEKITGDAKSASSARNCIFQLQQALQEPWLHPDTGRSTRIEKAYLICSQEISQEALLSIKSVVELQSGKVFILDVIEVVELINKYFPDLLQTVSDDESRYMQSLAKSLAHVSSIASLQTGEPISLRDIYVRGSLVPTTYERAIQLTFATLAQESRVTAVDLDTLLLSSPRGTRICVVADVGAGKTSLLQKFALDATDRFAANGKVSEYPLFLRLASFRPSRMASDQSAEFEAWLESQVVQLAGDFSQLVNLTRRAVVLLDGFDEIPFQHDAVWSAIEVFAQRYPVDFVVTTRPSRVPAVKSFLLYRLLPFSNEDIAEFLRKWFSEKDKQEEVFRTVLGNDLILRFCRAPLLLTLLAAIARRNGIADLPSRRTQFFEKAINLLLGWDASRGVVNAFPESVKLHFLQDLAIRTHEGGNKQMYADSLLKVSRSAIMPIYKQVRLTSGLNSEEGVTAQFLDEVVFRSNIIRRTGKVEYEFSHLSFQEFFAASYIRRTSSIAEYFGKSFDSWWRGVMLFAIGFVESISPDYIAFLRKRGSRTAQNVHFLLEYLSEAPYTERPNREKIFQIVAGQLLNSGALSEELIAECRPHDEAILTYLTSKDRNSPRHSLRLVYLACRFGGVAWKYIGKSPLDELKNDRNSWDLRGLFTQELAEILRAALAVEPRKDWQVITAIIFRLCADQISTRIAGLPSKKDQSYVSEWQGVRNLIDEVEKQLHQCNSSIVGWSREIRELRARLEAAVR